MNMAASSALLLACLAASAAEAQPRRVAVVVGIERYEHLPDVLRVVGARGDATRVAEALETQGGYELVRLLTDASATTANLDELVQGRVSPGLGPEDLFLFYFVGHGIGGDFGEPRLLMYDSDPDALDATSWLVEDLGAAFARHIGAGQMLLVTDAAHRGALDDLALMGPIADHWPASRAASMRLSAAGPRETGQPGAFAEVFIEAVSGLADSSGDGSTSSGELYRYLLKRIPGATGDGQHPTADAGHDPGIAVFAQLGASVRTARGDERIDKVKFVFRDGISPTVECLGAQVTACDPTCYLWNIRPGTCLASAVFGDRRQLCEALVLERGRWICQDAGAGLACTEGNEEK